MKNTVNNETNVSGVEKPRQSPGRRLLRALCLLGHPKIKPWVFWSFFIPQLLIYLYLLGPVFVYYTKGVPSKESLEVITGTWRVEGQLSSNSNGLVAPRYFVDTESGARQVHCGFPMQKRRCGISFGPSIRPSQKVKIYYDRYFGILAFEHLDPARKDIHAANLSYEEGVFHYAQPKDTIYHNYHAHQMLIVLMLMYLVAVFFCLRAGTPNPFSQANTEEINS